MAIGKCKLTGKNGPFVKCHILPQAFTKPMTPGAPLIQVGDGHRPSQRWTSWYDKNIVTRAGEDSLEKIDTKAIAELRRLKLVWSGWSGDSLLDEQTEAFRNPLFRIIDGVKSDTIKLFFHSLLWRSATSRLSEFAEIEIDEINLKKIGDMILNGDAGSHIFYPCLLSQISTRGLFHNHSPITDSIEIPRENDNPLNLKTFRYYFDGLVAYIFHDMDVAEAASFLNNDLFVGHSSRLIVSTHAADDSRQYAQFAQAVAESAEIWPDHRV